MKSKIASSRTLILNALLDGQKLTTFRANTIGKTTEGGRRIRELREHYPIKKEQVPGESYYQYYLPAEYLPTLPTDFLQEDALTSASGVSFLSRRVSKDPIWMWKKLP